MNATQSKVRDDLREIREEVEGWSVDMDPHADTDPDPRPPQHTPAHGIALSAPLADSAYRPR